jgi:hypothetical protein
VLVRRGHAFLAYKISITQQRQCGLFALLGDGGYADLTFLNVVNGVRRIALGENHLLVPHHRGTLRCSGLPQKGFRIEPAALSAFHKKALSGG